MASSPILSPSISASPLPRRFSPSPSVDLTPRSKVRALLAPFEDDSDKENESSITETAGKRIVGNSHSSPTAVPLNVRSDGALEENRPAGRGVVLSLHSQEDRSWEKHLDNEEENNAYARIKRQLLASAKYDGKIQAVPNIDDTNVADTPSNKKRKRISGHILNASAGEVPESPKLFVSPESDARIHSSTLPELEDASSSDFAGFSNAGERLKALVAQKRSEREAKEKLLQSQESADSEDSNGIVAKAKVKKFKKARLVLESESDNDRDASKKLTQQARPTRKASKKAIEEISRETQRMSRNMQLTHEAKTKIKFTTQDLFAKFNFRQSAVRTEPDYMTTSSAAASSDIDAVTHSTPPSSPPSGGENSEKTDKSNVLAATSARQCSQRQSAQMERILPTLEDASAQSLLELHDPKSFKTTRDDQKFLQSGKKAEFDVKMDISVGSSDEDLEIVTGRETSRLAIFDQLPPAAKRDSRSIQTLRALAQVHNQERPKANAKLSLTPAELHISLRRRAREQALIEKAEKIQALRDKGVIIQTAEEKEKDQLELESLVEKARKEAAELAKREKEAAKKTGNDNESHLPDSEDDEDDDWDGEDEDEADEQLSGSEEENVASEDGLSEALEDHNEEEEDDDNEEGEDAEDIEEEDEEEEEREASQKFISTAVNFFDAEAFEEAVDGDDEASNVDEDELPLPKPLGANRFKRRRTVVLPEEDEDDETIDNGTPASAPEPQKRTDVDLFGFAIAPAAALGLTQVFAGTMSESQTQAVDYPSRSPGLPLTFTSLPSPDFGPVVPFESEDVLVENSQTQLREQPSDATIPDRLSQTPLLETQISDLPEPTQDMGFQTLFQTQPTASYSSVATVPLTNTVPFEEPVLKKRTRLLRRIVDDETIEEDNDTVESDPKHGLKESTDAFDNMRKFAIKATAINSYDKKRSNARGMVEEQAEESEDEYAGLGGASDDESQGELDEDTKKLIDDESSENVNEQELAAYHADKEREDDEKRVEKLFKDINGGWRRKRGADVDFSDSDDDGTARRQAKQREFARMRRALLADEKLGKIAENPKQQAFLHAIEDRDDVDALDLLDGTEESQPAMSFSQDSFAGSQFATDRVPKRPHATLRRPKAQMKPTSLAHIRTTLSELIGESESALASPDEAYRSSSSVGSDDEKLEQQHNSDDQFDAISADTLHIPPSPTKATTSMAPPDLPITRTGLSRRSTHPSVARRTVIDRMALKRAKSSLSKESAVDSLDKGPLAFDAPSLSRSNSGFRPPSLLRRATTASSTSSSSTSGSGSNPNSRNGGAGAGNGEGTGKTGVKMGAGPGVKRSSVNWYVREKELRARVQEVEKRRVEGRERVGRMRRETMLGGGGGGLRAVGGGMFE